MTSLDTHLVALFMPSAACLLRGYFSGVQIESVVENSSPTLTHTDRREQSDISKTQRPPRPVLAVALENLQSTVSLSSSLNHQCAYVCLRAAQKAQ
jgi:hypothetical protein